MATSLMFQLDFVCDSMKVKGQEKDSGASCATLFIALVSGPPSQPKHSSYPVCPNL